MTQYSSQFAIIDKIKSIVKKTGHFFVPERNSGISEAIARKIQRSAYEVSKLPEKDVFTPPYLWIAEQLQSKDNQIFRGAVYYLADIAVNEAGHTDAILEILNKYASAAELLKEQTDYVKTKIAYVKKNRKKAKK